MRTWILALATILCSCSTNDLAEIERLHAIDETASKAKDFETLASLWTDDCVVLQPGGPIVRGSAQLREQRRQLASSMQDVEVLEYDLQFEEVVVLGDHAIEWGTVRGTSRRAGETTKSEHRVMRVLRRTEDGWRVHRAIYN